MNSTETKEKILTQIASLSLADLLGHYPFLIGYLDSAGIEMDIDENLSLKAYLLSLGEEFLEDQAIDTDAVLLGAGEYIEQMLAFLDAARGPKVSEITLLPGRDKSGNPEGFEKLSFRRSEVISIVGPTGSGKSRLLADIEWMAQGDTPTGRRLLVNGEVPEYKRRFSTSDKLVAQLSQNMNFVMDLTVEEFVLLHAESRLIEEPDLLVKAIIEKANELAGEPFDADTAITSLSGGQSRALMIADTALLSSSPIVLIDEIENAGIDRKKALALLLSEEKIVLMATHDPMLALGAHRRLVIKNGGIAAVIDTTAEERKVLSKVEELDRKVQDMRSLLRGGGTLTEFNF
jgi:ABC-type lipoprotein export system ATPase subunit